MAADLAEPAKRTGWQRVSFFLESWDRGRQVNAASDPTCMLHGPLCLTVSRSSNAAAAPTGRARFATRPHRIHNGRRRAHVTSTRHPKRTNWKEWLASTCTWLGCLRPSLPWFIQTTESATMLTSPQQNQFHRTKQTGSEHRTCWEEDLTNNWAASRVRRSVNCYTHSHRQQ
jgi:hypothetical protein